MKTISKNARLSVITVVAIMTGVNAFGMDDKKLDGFKYLPGLIGMQNLTKAIVDSHGSRHEFYKNVEKTLGTDVPELQPELGRKQEAEIISALSKENQRLLDMCSRIANDGGSGQNKNDVQDVKKRAERCVAVSEALQFALADYAFYRSVFGEYENPKE